MHVYSTDVQQRPPSRGQRAEKREYHSVYDACTQLPSPLPLLLSLPIGLLAGSGSSLYAGVGAVRGV